MTNYANCGQCGEEVLPENMVNNLCGFCASRRGAANSNREALDKILLTTEMATDLNVVKRFGVVASERIYGVNIFKDMFASVRDIVGGANKSGEDVLRDARNSVLLGLKEEALALGANAVVAVDVDYNEVSGGGKSMLLVAATGTAVKISE